MNPIHALIYSVMKGKGVARLTLVKSLGYRNVNRGLRRIDDLLLSGTGRKALLAKIAEVLGIDQEQIDKALDETRELLRKEREYSERKKFRPYIYVQHASQRPCSITIVAFVGVDQFKFILVPWEITALPLQQQVESVSTLVREHYQGKGTRCTMFGEITGYIYRYSFDEGISFSVHGELLNADLKRKGSEWSPQATLTIGGKRVTGSLFKDLEVKGS